MCVYFKSSWPVTCRICSDDFDDKYSEYFELMCTMNFIRTYHYNTRGEFSTGLSIQYTNDCNSCEFIGSIDSGSCDSNLQLHFQAPSLDKYNHGLDWSQMLYLAVSRMPQWQLALLKYHASHHDCSYLCHVSGIQKDSHFPRCNPPGCPDSHRGASSNGILRTSV